MRSASVLPGTEAADDGFISTASCVSCDKHAGPSYTVAGPSKRLTLREKVPITAKVRQSG